MNIQIQTQQIPTTWDWANFWAGTIFHYALLAVVVWMIWKLVKELTSKDE